MNSQELINSGMDAANSVIKYLAKDAVGSEFLNKYMTSRDAQAAATEKQKQSLNKLIETSSIIDQDTKDIQERAENNAANLNKIYNEIANLKNSVAKITEQNQHYVSLFTDLISQTAKITALVDSIQNISEQTNLLSFNASIEAAHAGKAGAGFRIIANEVKKLSDSTKKTSEEIKQNVELLKKSIGNLENETKNNTESLKGLSTETDSTLEKFDSVRKMNTENNANVEKITSTLAGNIQNINGIISNVQEAEQINKNTLDDFASCASKNQMLFNDLYSFIYEIKAVLTDLKNPEAGF